MGRARIGAPARSFGTSTREQNAKLYVSVEMKKGLHGMHSPGPHAAYYLGARRESLKPWTTVTRLSCDCHARVPAHLLLEPSCVDRQRHRPAE